MQVLQVSTLKTANPLKYDVLFAGRGWSNWSADSEVYLFDLLETEKIRLDVVRDFVSFPLHKDG